MEDAATNTGESSLVLTVDMIRKAVKALKKASKQPFIVSITSKLDSIEILKQSTLAFDFSVHMGIPVYQDETVPERVFRFNMSDGTFDDIPITSKVNFLPLSE